MPYHEFSVSVDAVRFPAEHHPSGPVQLRWFLNDATKGASAAVQASGPEAAFLFSAKFGVESKGIITQLLQISVVEVVEHSGETKLCGVLMVDLNAHTPKPPRKLSKQRATLNMARCPYPQPLLIRLTLECAPAVPPSLGSPGAGGLPRGGVGSLSPLPRPIGSDPHAGSPPPPASHDATTPVRRVAAADLSGLTDDPTVANVARLRALVSTLTAGSDQLRDENTMLRRAVDRARAEADLAGASPVARGESSEAAGADGAAADQETLQRVRRERDTLKNDLGVAQRGLFSAKEQLRVMINKDDEHKKEAAKLTKERVFQAEENGRLAKELDAYTLTESLKRELKVARVEADEADTRSLLLVSATMSATVQSAHVGGGGLLRGATPSAAP